MTKQKTLQKYVYKIHSTRLRKSKWNLKLDISTAMKNNEIISLADSTTLRFIDELNDLSDAEEKAKEIKANIKQLKKSNNTNRSEIKKLYEELNRVQFKPDYLCLIIDEEKDYWTAFKRGFKVNGVKYKRLLGTNGGVKGSTIVFTSVDLFDELRKRLDNGRNKNVEMVPAKFGAYESLSCSSSIPVSDPKGMIVVKDCEVDFFENIIKLDDEESDEPKMEYIENYHIHKTTSDGFGLVLPNRSHKWGKELGLDYTPSGFNSRAYAFEKGMLVTFDFVKFGKLIAKKYIITDAWGDKRDIRDSDVIITTSMLKLWDSYSSFEDYMNNCRENNYKFCITKVCPNMLENERNLNYQFIQSYQLTDDDIIKLIQPTIDEIHDILGRDYKKTILFLKGVNLNNDTIEFIEDDFAKALMIDNNMMNDPYVRSKIHNMIRKRINDAKVGVLRVNGNFQIACGDPYILCESMFGLEKKGLLKAGDFYSKYWSDKNTKEVVCFRAPMTCHNNIRKLNISCTPEQEYWYKYIKTMLIFNSWDTAADAMNGEDFDADQNLTTDNDVLLRNTRNLPTIMCIQRKAKKKVIEEIDLVEANIASFGDDIGMYTNGITSQFDVQAQFDVNSKEYKTLEYRIMCGQLFQQNAIDKTKGIIAKPRPKNWFDMKANKITPDDSEKTKKKKEFYKSIVADKKPYFMKYIYPQTMKQYNDYIEKANQKCLCEFKLTIDELISKPNKTTFEIDFLNYYYKRFPVGNHDCIINKICWAFEREFDGYLNSVKHNAESKFDYSILKSDVKYTQDMFKKIYKIYSDYIDKVQKFQQMIKKERIKDEEVVETRKSFVEAFIQECNIACPNEKQLANIVIDICYSSNKSKQFTWDICGSVIVDNLLCKNGYIINYPEADENGEIEFGGMKFIMKAKQIGGFNE